MARRLVQQGDDVEWFSAAYPGAATEETLEGVHIVREGRQWTVHWAALRHYRGKLRGRFDVVVDQVNTIPFFTPVWANVAVVMLIHQLAREVWWYETAFPLNVVGFLAEPVYLRLYRNVEVLTVSASTRDDLRALGFNGPIVVVPEGLEPITFSTRKKGITPRFVYVGRLARSKRLADLIQAFAIFCRAVEPAELSVVGEGPLDYVSELSHLARTLGVSDRVHFTGRLPIQAKHAEMAAAHALLLTSVREGWGLVVTEANALGTPAVAYNVRGVRDSIQDRDTGLLVQATPGALADGMAELWRHPDLYERLARSALAFSTGFSFDATTIALRAALAESIDHLDKRPRGGAPVAD